MNLLLVTQHWDLSSAPLAEKEANRSHISDAKPDVSTVHDDTRVGQHRPPTPWKGSPVAAHISTSDKVTLMDGLGHDSGARVKTALNRICIHELRPPASRY